jgi:hypothetical protein
VWRTDRAAESNDAVTQLNQGAAVGNGRPRRPLMSAADSLRGASEAILESFTHTVTLLCIAAEGSSHHQALERYSPQGDFDERDASSGFTGKRLLELAVGAARECQSCLPGVDPPDYVSPMDGAITRNRVSI